MRRRKESGALSRGAFARIASRNAFRRAYSAAKSRIGGQKPLHLDHAGGVEFAVERGVQQERAILETGSGHGAVPSFWASSARARASRDITVPMGAPVASEMSR